MPEPLASVRPPVTLRGPQREALAALRRTFAAGHRRAWVVLPPGLGKTLTGLEAARRLGRQTVVFGPNTAIQGQWVGEWSRFVPTPPEAGTSRDLSSPVSVLTYQSLASFDPDAEVSEDGSLDGTAHLHRLRPRGRALVSALREAGEVTLLLDECHHLLDTWGELLAELLRELPQALVIGLTATPPERLSASQAELVAELFGPALRGPSIPAAVRDGYLAPYAELAWLTEPAPDETSWLATGAERFTELTTRLMDPDFASVPFLDWLDQRVVHRRGAAPDTLAQPAMTRSGTSSAPPADSPPRPADGGTGSPPPGSAVGWHRFARDHPALATAALRFHHQGLLALPDGARLLEKHRRPADAADWVCLLDDWIRHCLRRTGLPGDQAAVAEIRAALPSVGYQLTARGVRVGRSPVDRVLARSAAKTAAVREILSVEADALADRLRGVVFCDHERATATLPAGLAGVLDAQAGSARLVLDQLAGDPRTASLHPLLITGRTVAAAPATAEEFLAFCARATPGIALDTRPAADLQHAVEITGPWTSRDWVVQATRFFEQGGSQVLIGTRGLLGEGWNAHRITTMVDLTEATTATAVVQTRGRALRLDPRWPQKTATTWSVVCVAPQHPRGTSDWERFVRKHEGYLGVTASGAIMSGVSHVDPALSPYTPPPAEEFAAFNAAMLVRAAQREHTRAQWRIGEPYDDLLAHTVRIVPPPACAPAPHAPVTPPELPSGGARLPAAVPAARGTVPETVPGGRIRSALTAVSAGTLSAAAGLLAGVGPALVPLPALLGAAGGYQLWRTAARTWQVREAACRPVIPAVACAVADGLRTAGLTPRGAEAVVIEPDETGVYQVRLSQVPPPASECFAMALDEALAPVTSPRYLMPRYLITDQRLRAVVRRTTNVVVYHAVPAVLGENRRRADGYAAAWRRRVSDGEPVYSRSPEGAGLLAAQAGRSPLDVTTALRLSWS